MTGFVFESEEDAQRACWWWQKVLRLADWEIRCWIRRQENIGPDAQAAYASNQKLKDGWIKLVDPIDYPQDTDWPQDHECSLVHELLHFHMAAFAPAEDNIPYEQAVELIAQALVNLRRLAYQKPPWRVKDGRE